MFPGKTGGVKLTKSFWTDKNVFVTGCTGLLGSWLTNELVEKGANVTGLIRDVVPTSNFYRLGLHSKVNMVRGQLEDIFCLERALNEYEVDTVFHVGAQTIVTIANRNPISTFEANIKGTWNLLEACRKTKTVSRIVVASSDKAYGESGELPYGEDHPLQGSHPYDASKSCADLIAQAYYATWNLPVCVTRCGNFYGGGDLNFNRIVPGTIKAALFGTPVTIRSDGTYKRDYIFILDAVQAYLMLAEKMSSLPILGQAFNFSNEKPLTVLEIVQKILTLMGKQELKPEILNEVRGEIKDQFLSAQKAMKMLGWKPRYSLEEGLRRTVDWYTEFFREYKARFISSDIEGEAVGSP